MTHAQVMMRIVPPATTKLRLGKIGVYTVVRSYAEHAVGAILGIGHSMVRNCFERMPRNNMAPSHL